MEIQASSRLGVRLKNSDRRLKSPGNERELIAATFWQEFNVPRSMQGHTAWGDIIGQDPHEKMDEQAVALGNTFAQWLGSHVGAVFMRDLMKHAAKQGHPFHEIEKVFVK
jgi:hypothetical protein